MCCVKQLLMYYLEIEELLQKMTPVGAKEAPGCPNFNEPWPEEAMHSIIDKSQQLPKEDDKEAKTHMLPKVITFDGDGRPTGEQDTMAEEAKADSNIVELTWRAWWRTAVAKSLGLRCGCSCGRHERAAVAPPRR